MRPAARARAIAHVDMDAFYAAIEQRDRPDLRGRPVVVGADPKGRGVVSAASYEARRFGVRSAMPIVRAARLCPDAAFLPVDMAKYHRVKFVAKVASDLEKPDGLVVVPPGGEARFLAPLPVERIWGVGRVTAGALRELGFGTIGQLQRVPRAVLARRFGKHGEHLHDLALGRDERPVEPFGVPKSVGAEETFGVDTTDAGLLRTTLRAQAERVAAELRESGFAGARVTLKLRLQPFETHTRSVTGEPTQDGLELYRRALALLERARVARPVRLIGLSASRLGPAGSGQLDLLDPTALARAFGGPAALSRGAAAAIAIRSRLRLH